MNAFEREIAKANRIAKTLEKIAEFQKYHCPFCRERELFVYPLIRNQRTWWTIGCDSRSCNSSWTLAADTYDQAIELIRTSNNLKNPLPKK